MESPFIHHALKLVNFGPNIRKWISVLYNGVERGYKRRIYHELFSGVKRRKARMSSESLVIHSCVEILAQKIRENPKISGI